MRTLTKSLPEAGRIRIGDRVPTGDGKHTRPNKLQQFRFTSSHKYLLDYAAQAWGGTVRPWEGEGSQPGHWELYTLANQLDVLIPTTFALQVQYERWVQGGCQWRCNGTTVTHAPLQPAMEGTLCQAEDGEPDCPCGAQRVTRLNLMLPDIPGTGLWRLETKGFYATSELLGSLELFRLAGEAMRVMEATLRLEWRKVKRLGKDEKGKTRGTLEFAVPVLMPKFTPRELLSRAEGYALLHAPVREQRAIAAANDLFGDGAGDRLIAQPVSVDIDPVTEGLRRDARTLYRELKALLPASWLPEIALACWAFPWGALKELGTAELGEGIARAKRLCEAARVTLPMDTDDMEAWIDASLASQNAQEAILVPEGSETQDDDVDATAGELRSEDGQFQF